MGKLLTIVSCVLVTLFLFMSVVEAAGLEGQPAPPINAKEWINAEEGTTLKDFKGKIVFIEFTATW